MMDRLKGEVEEHKGKLNAMVDSHQQLLTSHKQLQNEFSKSDLIMGDLQVGVNRLQGLLEDQRQAHIEALKTERRARSQGIQELNAGTKHESDERNKQFEAVMRRLE